MTESDFNQVIEKAIQAEIDAANYYRNLQNIIKVDASKVILKELENMEWGHMKILQNIDSATVESYQKQDIRNLGISETLHTPAESAHLTIQEILITAIKREENAWKMYTSLSEETEDIRIKLILLKLADEEAKHKLQLETIYDTEILYEN
jgi:rubrerythrin